MSDPVDAEPTPSKSPKGAKAAAQELKNALLTLILDDPDIIQALKVSLGLPLTDGEKPGILGASDAEHAALVQDLILKSFQQHLRPEALRRPILVS